MRVADLHARYRIVLDGAEPEVAVPLEEYVRLNSAIKVMRQLERREPGILAGIQAAELRNARIDEGWESWVYLSPALKLATLSWWRRIWFRWWRRVRWAVYRVPLTRVAKPGALPWYDTLPETLLHEEAMAHMRQFFEREGIPAEGLDAMESLETPSETINRTIDGQS